MRTEFNRQAVLHLTIYRAYCLSWNHRICILHQHYAKKFMSPFQNQNGYHSVCLWCGNASVGEWFPAFQRTVVSTSAWIKQSD